jgi:uncharacterized protein
MSPNPTSPVATPPHIVIAGGSGFIGRGLTKLFAARGFEAVVLTRTAKAATDNIRWTAWDGATPGAWTRELEGATAVINLAGHTINCPHTPANRKLIVTSRVLSVRAITDAIRCCQRPPSVLVQSSAVGFYGDTGSTPRGEASLSGDDFRAEACRAWEEALDPATIPTTRCVTLRTGVVLGRDGGALPTLARLTRWFLGGAVGNGRQFISWIHQEDFNRIVLAAIEDRNWNGVFNATAPHPATNADFMRELRRALHRPWSPPVPTFAVRLAAPLLGTDAALALESQYVVSRQLQAVGFQFRFPHLREALENLERQTA